MTGFRRECVAHMNIKRGHYCFGLTEPRRLLIDSDIRRMLVGNESRFKHWMIVVPIVLWRVNLRVGSCSINLCIGNAMKRHFYISDDLDDLDRIEQELESSGVHKPQIHVFSKDDAGVEAHDHLHNIESVFKQDVAHGTITGAVLGAGFAASVLIFTSISELTSVYTWWPFIFLAVALFGFCTWVGGLYGIQAPHRDFKRFEPQLRAGKHVFIVDVDPDQEATLKRVERAHPNLQLAGMGSATPRWVVMWQHNVKQITSRTFP